ncbi:hypothetical protein L6164_020472 [Bauhinia variegata]|uniref:Uncharacterized protein n=1 Tax=Bauhinia variegata TaxID=167791 RepID=A0ACB9N006_BAUVA|nr:hypothetical protein L6164_020472 [Bauhinia variegata]
MAKNSASNPSWFTPKRLLLIFCVINMINYMDRGAIASNGVNGSLGSCTDSGICTSGSGIQGDFNLSNFQDGILSSAFMVGLLVASPIFASLAKSHDPFRLIGVGLSVWTFAVAGCGSSFDFWSIAICRMLVGVGEASFISLAAPFIDDNAPIEQKTAWLAMFYMCIPAGTALGYVYGGFVGSQFNWRVAFWGMAILMLPFPVLGFVMKPLQLKGFAPLESKEMVAPETEEVYRIDDGMPASDQACIRESKSSSKLWDQCTRFSKDMQVLLHYQVYVINVLGYISYNFVIGAYSYWGPKAGYNIYHMSNADLLFGGITIVCGIVGTLSGGLILDKMNSTISNAFKILSGATFLGTIFCLSAFCLRSLSGFIVLFSIGELLIFATQAPVNYISLHCVKPSLRPLSMAISTVSIHIFGDVPSSPLVGVLQDHIHNWRKTALILTSIFFLAAGIWFIGIFLQTVDLFNEDDEEQPAATRNGKTKPLLEASQYSMGDVAKDLTAGTVGGAAQLICGHPFDTIKVKLQSQPAPLPGQLPKYAGAMDAVKQTLAAEGPRGLYKGMGAPLATVAAFNAVLFTVRGQMETLLRSHPGAPLTAQQQVVAGAGAGVAVSFLACPTELIKCRLQAQSALAGAGAGAGSGTATVAVKYGGPMDVARQVLRSEGGTKGLFKGLVPTMAREIPGNAVMFGVYEAVKQLIAGGSDTSKLGRGSMIVAGGLAGASFWLLVYPTDVVKSVIQVDDCKNPKYSGSFDAFRKIKASEGFKGLYKGFGPAMARSVPANAACFLAYEVTRSALG